MPTHQVAQESAIEELLSIGPFTAALLREIGVVTVTRLRELGSIETFRLLRQVDPSLGLQVLWRLESALASTPIRKIRAERRAVMRRMIGGDPSAPPRRPGNKESWEHQSKPAWKTQLNVPAQRLESNNHAACEAHPGGLDAPADLTAGPGRDAGQQGQGQDAWHPIAHALMNGAGIAAGGRLGEKDGQDDDSRIRQSSGFRWNGARR